MTRRESREQAFILIFEKLFNQDVSIEDIVSAAQLSETNMPDDFSVKLAECVYEHIEEIDEIINKYARGWSKDRISKVSLALLRLSICEIMFYDEIPASVSINEAVELAKTYAASDDASFVNGLLGSYVKAQ